MLSFRQYFKHCLLKEDVTLRHDGWLFIDTKHSEERMRERTDFDIDQHHRMLKAIHNALPNIKRAGEHMFTHRGLDRSYIGYVDPVKKHFRLITILPKGKHVPKFGTKKWVINDSVGFDGGTEIPVIFVCD